MTYKLFLDQETDVLFFITPQGARAEAIAFFDASTDAVQHLPDTNGGAVAFIAIHADKVPGMELPAPDCHIITELEALLDVQDFSGLSVTHKTAQYFADWVNGINLYGLYTMRRDSYARLFEYLTLLDGWRFEEVIENINQILSNFTDGTAADVLDALSYDETLNTDYDDDETSAAELNEKARAALENSQYSTFIEDYEDADGVTIYIYTVS